MKPPLAIIDTNVIASGLITNTPESPTRHILDGMLSGDFPFLLSMELIVEYRAVLLRPRLREKHGLDERGVNVVLEQIVMNGLLREPPVFTGTVPDKGDRHLWTLLVAETSAVLVTGDQALIQNPPIKSQVISPRIFAALLTS